MTVDLRYATFDDYPRIDAFFENHWAKNYVYSRLPELFEWTFARKKHWDREGYSFALAEHKGEIVGILGGIPFFFNCLGRVERAVWLANFMVRPEYRRGPLAVRLLNMFRRKPFESTITFGMTDQACRFYRALGWEICEPLPRHFLVLPEATGRMTELLRLARKDWDGERAKALAGFFSMTDLLETHTSGMNCLPSTWDTCDWPRMADRSIGAVRDLDYLTWRYLEHPCFKYRFLSVPEGDRAGLAVWRLETIYLAGPEGPQEFDRIGRLVEFLPASRANARNLLSLFLQQLSNADALGADYYGYYGKTRNWLCELGFQTIEDCGDGQLIPTRFCPLDRRNGSLLGAVSVHSALPAPSSDSRCLWYWTKSDGDQDRPN